MSWYSWIDWFYYWGKTWNRAEGIRVRFAHRGKKQRYRYRHGMIKKQGGVGELKFLMYANTQGEEPKTLFLGEESKQKYQDFLRRGYFEYDSLNRRKREKISPCIVALCEANEDDYNEANDILNGIKAKYVDVPTHELIRRMQGRAAVVPL